MRSGELERWTKGPPAKFGKPQAVQRQAIHIYDHKTSETSRLAPSKAQMKESKIDMISAKVARIKEAVWSLSSQGSVAWPDVIFLLT